MSAKVVSLQLHERHGQRPRAVASATATAGGGLVGDSHAQKTRRAVVVVDRDVLDALGLGFGDLREQITVVGLPEVSTLPSGTTLRIGGITLRVNGECEPCTHIGELNGRPDPAAFQKLLEHRRGAACTVVAAAGPLRVGDAVEVLVPA
ncbi:MAG TPA: MOSC domain-containing protein [Candidatus Limnocylindria bacterium]